MITFAPILARLEAVLLPIPERSALNTQHFVGTQNDA